MDKNKEALSTSPFEDGDGAFLDFRGKDVKPARSVLYLRNGNDGGIQRGQCPFLAHGLCLQSLVCYTLYLRVCEKSGTRILVAGFEADKKRLRRNRNYDAVCEL